jgi:hypothetical protein
MCVGVSFTFFLSRNANTEKRVPWRKKRKVVDSQSITKEVEGAREMFGEDSGFDSKSHPVEQTPVAATAVAVPESGIQLPVDFGRPLLFHMSSNWVFVDMKAYEVEKNRQESTIKRYGSVVKAIASELLESVEPFDPYHNLPKSPKVLCQGILKPLNKIDQADVDMMTEDEFEAYINALYSLKHAPQPPPQVQSVILSQN